MNMAAKRHKKGPIGSAVKFSRGLIGGSVDAADKVIGKVVGYNPNEERFLLFSQSMHTQPPNEHGTVSGSLTYIPHGTKVELLKKSKHRLLVHGFFGPTEFWGWTDDSNVATKRVYKQTHGDDPEGATRNPAKFDRCVRDVQASGRPGNAYAICTASGTRNPAYRKASFDSQASAAAFVRVMEADKHIAILSKPEKKSGKWWVEFAEIGHDGGQAGNPLWPFIKHLGTKTTIKHVGTGRTYKQVGEAKGHKIYKDTGAGEGMEFVVPSLDKESKFESLKEAKRFVAANPKKKANPEDDAAAMYESFHGEPSKELLEFKDQEHYHSNLAGLGSMIGLKIRTITGFDWTVEFKDVMLCSNEEGTQLYLVGGDQYLELDDVKIPDTHDSTVVGEAWLIGYRTEKEFDDFKPIDYIHGFGNEKDHPKLPKGADLWDDATAPVDESFGCGNYPTVRYDCLNHKIYLDGGSYKIDRPLIGTSPGIEG